MLDQARGRRAATPALVGWAFYDWANSAFPTVVQTFVFAAYLTGQVASDPAAGQSAWGQTLGLAGLVVALSAPLLGAAFDHFGHHKRALLCATLLCALSAAALWTVTPDGAHLLRGLLWVGIGTVAFEYASILYNAMLPQLAPAGALGRWSGWGWGLGYVGGLACLCLVLFGLILHPPAALDAARAEPVRASFVIVGVWMLLFSLPLALLTPETPRSGLTFAQALRAGAAQLGDSLRHLRRYGNILRFLVARMIYADGLATLFAFGGVYAAGSFGMDTEGVLRFGIALNLSAGLGAFAFGFIDDRIGSRTTIAIGLVALIGLGSALLMVTQVAWFWALGVALGVFVGPVQSASRALLAQLSPAGLRTQMFGLYAFSGKATAFAGPLLVAAVTTTTGSQRLGMSVIVIMLAVGLALLASVRSPGKAA